MALHRFEDQETPLQGVFMEADDFERLISQETSRKYELIGGILYDMTGSTPEHADIAYNVLEAFKLQLGKQGPCRAYQEQYIAIPNSTPLCPDVVLTCDISDRDKDRRLRPFRIQSPLIVVEVLSPSTEKKDRGEKFARYITCPTLEIYMLFSQYEPRVEVYRRANDWQQEIFTAGQTILLDQLDLEFPLNEIYEGIF